MIESIGRCLKSNLIIAAVFFSSPQSVVAQDLSCSANAPSVDSEVDARLLPTVLSRVNAMWPSAATKIDPLVGIPNASFTKACPSDAGTACFFELGLTTCEHLAGNVQIDQLTDLSKLVFQSIASGSFNEKDVALHLEKGPDASKITDGAFAPEGSNFDNPSYAVILPLPGVGSALMIDLGTNQTICGSGQCAPKVQADRHPFQFDYSTNGVDWVSYSKVPSVSGSGLRTRGLQQITSNKDNPDFTARYVRIYGIPADDTNFSVSEVLLKDPKGKVISVQQPAVGPRPYQIADGVLAPEGTTWNDKNYAVVLRKEGEGHALVIDLGGVVSICGSSACGPVIQADKNEFRLDYSLDGTNWITYSTLPTVSGTGLRTRGLQAITSGQENPDFNARFVRIVATAGDGNYSVSEVALKNSLGASLKVNNTYGPEGIVFDGEVAPEGASFNNPLYATLLSPCAQSSNSVCPSGTAKAVTGALAIDLTAAFPISKVIFQGDRHPFQIDYLDENSGSWKALWTVPAVSGNGLLTRPALDLSAQLPMARHLMVYGLAADDLNYSISSIQIFTAKAKTPCAYNSGANTGQNLACSYDGPSKTEFTFGTTGLPIAFTVTSAEAHLRCTNGTTTKNLSVASVSSNTKCSGTLQLANNATAVSGEFCSGVCEASSKTSVLTNLTLGTVPFMLSSVTCSNDLGDLSDAVAQVAAGTAAKAIQGFFNALVRSPLPGPNGTTIPPLIPSNVCPSVQEAPKPEKDIHTKGLATHVGLTQGDATVKVSGRFKLPNAVSLKNLVVRLDRILSQEGGAGELVRRPNGAEVSPIVLGAMKGSSADHAMYRSKKSNPRIRITLTRVKNNRRMVQFVMNIRKATIPTLPVCIANAEGSVTRLRTTFSILKRRAHKHKQDRAAVAVDSLRLWSCRGVQLKTLAQE